MKYHKFKYTCCKCDTGIILWKGKLEKYLEKCEKMIF